MLSAKHRDDNIHSYDDLTSAASRPSKTPSKARKSNSTANSLPIPTHTRAASTPAHTEKPPTELSVQHRRSPSCVESITRNNSSDPGFCKDTSKKISVDNFAPPFDERETKRASSETKEKFTKRNASSPAAISLLNFTNEKLQKISFDEMNRHKSHKHKSSLKATPELLAELLKGSSEKMAAAERSRKNVDYTMSLPNAVLRCLVSSVHPFYINHNERNKIEQLNSLTLRDCVEKAQSQKAVDLTHKRMAGDDAKLGSSTRCNRVTLNRACTSVLGS